MIHLLRLIPVWQCVLCPTIKYFKSYFHRNTKIVIALGYQFFLYTSTTFRSNLIEFKLTHNLNGFRYSALQFPKNLRNSTLWITFFLLKCFPVEYPNSNTTKIVVTSELSLKDFFVWNQVFIIKCYLKGIIRIIMAITNTWFFSCNEQTDIFQKKKVCKLISQSFKNC